MHEFSVASSLLDLALREMQKEGARKILRVKVRVGRVSGVEAELLAFAFKHLREQRPETRGARLEIEIAEARALCLDCGTQFEPDDIIPVCPSCGGARCKITQGEELVLESLELEI